MQILSQKVWGGAREPAILSSSQGMQMPHLATVFGAANFWALRIHQQTKTLSPWGTSSVARSELDPKKGGQAERGHSEPQKSELEENLSSQTTAFQSLGNRGSQ